MNGTQQITRELIAPCGINCGICMAFLREKNKCYGCRADNPWKPKSRENCKIKNCRSLSETNSKFCFECYIYPCQRLKQLDKRYSTKYKMSNLENLSMIKFSGLDYFVQREKEKWKCSKCGGTICVHRGFCMDCEKK